MGRQQDEQTGAETQQIQDAGDLRKYRIELPNLYDDSDLDPYEFRLLAHYKRVGNCNESTRTTAEKCKMSVGKVSEARDSLHAKGFIVIDEFVSKYDTLQITVVDRWAENFAKYAKMKADKQARSQGEQTRSPHEQGCSPHEQGCSPHETKKEPYKELNNNNDRWHQELVQLTGGYMGGAQEFQDLTDAWQRFPDERRHIEAKRQLQNAHSRTIRVYLKAFLTFNPDYVPPSKPTYSARGKTGSPRAPAEYIPPTEAERAAFRAQLARAS